MAAGPRLIGAPLWPSLVVGALFLGRDVEQEDRALLGGDQDSFGQARESLFRLVRGPPPMLNELAHGSGKRPTCVFVNALWSQDDLRERTKGVASTWGSAARLPPDMRVLYVVGATNLDPFPTDSIRDEQLVVLSAKNDPVNVVGENLSERATSTLNLVHGRFKNECGWFVFTEDDAYVNTGRVAETLACHETNKPLWGGAIMLFDDGKPFLHGSMTVTNRPGLEVLAKASDACHLPQANWGDVRLEECLMSYQQEPSSNLTTEEREMQLTAMIHPLMNNTRGGSPQDNIFSAAKLAADDNSHCRSLLHKVVGLDAMTLVDKLVLAKGPCPRKVRCLKRVDAAPKDPGPPAAPPAPVPPPPLAELAAPPAPVPFPPPAAPAPAPVPAAATPAAAAAAPAARARVGALPARATAAARGGGAQPGAPEGTAWPAMALAWRAFGRSGPR